MQSILIVTKALFALKDNDGKQPVWLKCAFRVCRLTFKEASNVHVHCNSDSKVPAVSAARPIRASMNEPSEGSPVGACRSDVNFLGC